VWKKHPDFGKRENPTLEEYIHGIVKEALASTGVAASEIQKGYIGNFIGGLFSNQAHLGAMVVGADKALVGKPFARTEAACASGGIAVLACVDALQAGYDVVMALGAEVQTTVSAREGADYLARASHYATERSLDDFTFPCLFARRAKAYKEATGATQEDFGRVAVKAYSNANRNPYAHMRTRPLTLEAAREANADNPAFLSNPEYKDHLLMNDCSQVSDGASAMILATEDGLKRLGIPESACTELLSYGHSTSPLGQVEDFTFLDNAAIAASEAYGDAGLGPADMQVAEVHDCFAVTELMMYEALGFAARGQGAALIREGATEITGRIPVNTGGGLIGFGHPVGATGIKQVLEIFRQMKGQCGDYQLPTTPTYGISANMGGDDRTTVVIVQKNL
jgi:acetyl-CoA acyltransferase